MEESPPFLTLYEIDVLRNDLANISLQPPLDDSDQLNLEDDQDVAANNSMEDANQNEDIQVTNMSDEERHVDFEITPWA
ncbi:hypothetical protein PIB30_022428 [Stylosanthes scabra]|uniref:Uncharacterized protein n=1 Tax=Stylosanthes scabra TaxID=79078 RepID=A0ABU6Q9V8_9FABA|nr:hypothetical protein [Stylosanthes scabra]